MNMLVYNAYMRGRPQKYPYNGKTVENCLNRNMRWNKITRKFPVQNKNGEIEYPSTVSLWQWVRRNFKIKLVPR